MHSYEELPLPSQLEVAFWVVGLLCVPIAMWWFIKEITSPPEAFGTTLGVPVDTRAIVEAAQPLIWIFGLVVGVRVRCWLRNVVVDRLNKVM